MPRELTRLSKTAFTGLDYSNIITDIINLVTDNPNYNANWGDFLSSDAGRMMIELFAYISDQLATRIDWVSNEIFIGTATQKNSAIRLLKLLNYNFTLPVAAQVAVDIALTDSDWGDIDKLNSAGFNLTVGYANGDTAWSPYSLTATNLKGATRTFECLDYNSATNVYNYASSVAVDSQNKTLTFYEGQTAIDTFTATTDNNPIFTLTSTDIIENSVLVRLVGDSDSETTLVAVNSFLDPNAQNETYSTGDTIPLPYVMNVAEDDLITIEFGPTSLLSSTTRRLSVDQQVRVIYRIGGGADGNIVKNAIPPGTAVTMYVTPIGGSSPVGITPTFVNSAAGTSGADAETSEHASVYAPLQIRTANKTVTEEDYEIILSENTNIITTKSYGGLNMPTDFYDLYGEYIKPLDVWNFLVTTTTGYTALENSEYKDFKWMSYRLENRFNGIYNFTTGVFNDTATVTAASLKVGDSIMDWFGDTAYNWYAWGGCNFYDGDSEAQISVGDSYWFGINGDSYRIIVGDSDVGSDSTTYNSIKDRMNTVILAAGDSYVVSIAVKGDTGTGDTGDTGPLDFKFVSGDTPGDTMIVLFLAEGGGNAGDTLWANLPLWGDSFGSYGTEAYGDTFYNFVVVDTTTDFRTAMLNAATPGGDSFFRLKVSTAGDTAQVFKSIANTIVGDSLWGDSYAATTWRATGDIAAYFRSNVEIQDGIDLSSNNRLELGFDGDTVIIIDVADGAVDPEQVRSYEIASNINKAFYGDSGYGISGAGDTAYGGDSLGLTGVATIEIPTGDTKQYLLLTSPKSGDSSKVYIRVLGDSDASETLLGSVVSGDTGDSFTCRGTVGITVITKVNPDVGDTSITGKLIYEAGTINFPGGSQTLYIHYLSGDTNTIHVGNYFDDTYTEGTDIEWRDIARRVYNSYYTTDGDSIIDAALSSFAVKFTNTTVSDMSINVVNDSWGLDQAGAAYILGDTVIGDTIVVSGLDYSIIVNIDSKGDTIIDITAGDSSGSYSRATIIDNINTAIQDAYEVEGEPYTTSSYVSYSDPYLKLTSPTVDNSSNVKIAFVGDAGGDTDASGYLFGLADSSSQGIVGDFFLEYDSVDDIMQLTRATTSGVPDLNFYFHFVNDRRSEDHNTSNIIDEETYRSYLDDKKIIGINNVFKPTKFNTFDITGTIHYNKAYTESQVSSSVESMLSNNYSLLNSAGNVQRTHGLDVYRSKILDEIQGIAGVEYIELSYFGTDAQGDSTSDNAITCRFDEIILLSEKRYSGGSLIHGPSFTYTVYTA